MRRKKIAVAISSFLILSGIVDILLMMFYLNSISEGIYFSVHDPGRVVHRLVLLPVSVFVLIINFPYSAIKEIFLKFKTFAFLFFIILESLALCQAYNDASDTYYRRNPMPYDVPTGRSELIKLHHSIMAEITGPSTQEHPVNIKEVRRPYVEYANKVKGPEGHFWEVSTFYSKYSLFITSIGLSYVVFLFTIIALFSIERKRIEDSFLKAIVINVAVLSSWFIFKAYSEWYLNLGDFDVQKDGKFLVLPFDTLVLLLVVFFLYQKKKFLSYMASSSAILMAIAIIFVRLNPDLFFASLTFPTDLSMVNITSMLFTGCFGVGTVLWNFRSKQNYTESNFVAVRTENSSNENLISEEPNTLSKITLPDELIASYTSEITKLLVAEKFYLDPELTLNIFSKKLKIPVHHLSYILNEKMGLGFSDLVNQHRVEEAKRKLKCHTLQNIKIENIGYECGFNSKATFYRVFKKFCNQSPSEFQKSQQA
jgi:AraC-like DNA-binding protein